MSLKKQLQTRLSSPAFKDKSVHELVELLSDTTMKGILEDTTVSSLTTNVFTDGGSMANGKKNARAAYSVYFENPELSGLNVTKPVDKSLMQTNNVAELSGILEAFKIIQNNKKSIKTPVVLYSDSLYSIKCITQWYKGWVKNGWKNAKGEPVKNKELIQQILDIISTFDVVTIIEHVKSHQPEPENKDSVAWRIWNGNDICDRNIRELLKKK